MTTHGQVAKSMRETIEALRADVERLERARLRSADWLTFEKLEAERDALRALLHQSREVEGGAQTRVLDLEAERDALRAEVKRQVQTGVEWAATWASNQAELASLRQRADDCCRIGEQTCAALVAERDALRKAAEHFGACDFAGQSIEFRCDGCCAARAALKVKP
jgi:chromosome segregation ATPase